MKSIDTNNQASEIHKYIVKSIGHNWRLSTWKKKYIARLNKYGFDKCILAIDGFCAQPWWMENKSQDAPDVIFRSDKSFERFLVLGEKLRDHHESLKQIAEKEEREIMDRNNRFLAIREKLGSKNAAETARMQKKFESFREFIQAPSWNVFIEPLLFVSYINGIVTVFHENSSWIQDHYVPYLEEALGKPVVVINDPDGVLYE